MNGRYGSRARQFGGIGLWLVLIVLLGAVAVGALIASFILKNVDVTLLLRNQSLTAIIPQDLHGRAQVGSNLGLHMNETIRTTVPVNQRVQIPIDDTLNIEAIFDGEVPLKLKVHLKDTIPLKQVVELNTTVSAYLPELGSTLDIPLRGKIPIDTVVPVDLVIPVDQNVRLDFTTPVSARIKQTLDVPLRANIDAVVPINAEFNVPVLNKVNAVVQMPTTPSRAVITEGALKLPLRTLQLQLGEEQESAK